MKKSYVKGATAKQLIIKLRMGQLANNTIKPINQQSKQQDTPTTINNRRLLNLLLVPECYGTKNGYLAKCYQFHIKNNPCFSIFTVEHCYRKYLQTNILQQQHKQHNKA